MTPGSGAVVDAGLLDGLRLTGDRGGVVVGSDDRGRAIQAHLLQAVPRRLALLGGLYLATQLALRAVAAGAVVIVATGRPAAWQHLLRAFPAGDTTPRPFELRDLSPAPLPRAAEDAPVLVVQDSGAVPQEIYPARGAWLSTAYVLPYLHPQLGDNARSADLVLAQRLPVPQAQLAGRLWRLPPELVAELAGLPDDAAVALGRELWLPLRLVTTPRETDLLGPVRRGD